jgi:hypothetical protein
VGEPGHRPPELDLPAQKNVLAALNQVFDHNHQNREAAGRCSGWPGPPRRQTRPNPAKPDCRSCFPRKRPIPTRLLTTIAATLTVLQGLCPAAKPHPEEEPSRQSQSSNIRTRLPHHRHRQQQGRSPRGDLPTAARTGPKIDLLPLSPQLAATPGKPGRTSTPSGHPDRFEPKRRLPHRKWRSAEVPEGTCPPPRNQPEDRSDPLSPPGRPRRETRLPEQARRDPDRLEPECRTQHCQQQSRSPLRGPAR